MKRFLHIDFLRAAAIIGVIVIHVLSDNLTNPLNTFIWNYAHIIIVAFIFCSGYVMYALYAPKLNNLSSVGIWYKKRLIRLILPFYWYLFIHYSLIFLFPKFFSGLGLEFSWKFFLQSITLTGGINLNWLPLLFLQLAVIFPLLVIIFRKKRLIFWVYVLFAIGVTIDFTIWQFPYSHYRSIMWIPWSLFLILPWYFYDREQKRLSPLPYLLFSGSAAVVFSLLFIIWQNTNRSLTLIDNKYPPNLFYISYESIGSFLLLGISILPMFQKKMFAAFYQFISKVSYSLFFIHYIVLDFILSVQKVLGIHISVWYQLIFVMTISIVIAWIISWFLSAKKFLVAGK